MTGSNLKQQKYMQTSFDNVRVIYRDKAEAAMKRKERKISDLHVGSVTISFGSLNLRERKLTSLEGLELQPELRTLFIQDNYLKDLKHLSQPNLESLHAERNDIGNFVGCKRQPKLRSVHLEGNPVENLDLFVLMCCLSLNPELIKVNGHIVSKFEREMIAMLDRPALQIAIQQVHQKTGG